MLYSSLLPFVLLLIPLSVSAQTCANYGNSTGSGSCLCPAGFNPIGVNPPECNLPVCGGSLYSPAGAAPAGTGSFGNVSAGNCACSSGFTGPGCSVCTSSSACQTSLQGILSSSNSATSPGLNTALTCNTAPTVYAESHMSCSVLQPTLQAIFPLSSTLTITRSLNSSLVPGGAAGHRSVGLTSGDGVGYAQLWYNGVEQFYCRAEGCKQTVNNATGTGGDAASTWVCPILSCTCRPNTDFCGGGTASTSQNLTATINMLSGPLTVDCVGGGKCNFQQSLLQILFGSTGLELSSCSHGECVQQYVVDQAAGIVTATSSAASLSGGVIAGLAVVGALLLALIGLIVWAFLARKKARRNMIRDGELPPSGGVGVVWSGVGYEVKTLSHRSGGMAARIKGFGGKTSPSIEEGKRAGKAGGKVILQECDGSLPAGGFCAILGPSGAGKSTLVDVLAGKRKAGVVEGRVKYMRQEGGRVKIGYVDQSDVLSPTSTVLETLLFAAHLRLPENIPISIKQQRAHTVLSQLGLQEVADTRVGSVEHRGISGGEMRRVSIGIELVAAPDVLVLDEPTSGLDSVSASRLIKLLKNLSQTEKTTIIASIHQPSSALYHSFDQVCLLAGGRQLYFGPGGNAPAEFFAKQNRPCPPGYNIADHLLEIASTSSEGLLSGSQAQFGDQPSSSSFHSDIRRPSGSDQELIDTPGMEKGAYPPMTLSSEKYGHPADQRERNLAELGGEGIAAGEKQKKWYSPPTTHCATSFLTQLEVLSGREWRNLRRDKTLLVAHISIACILGLFAGGLYYQVNLTIAGFQNRVGSLFFVGSLIAFSSLSALYNLVEVRALFLRERAGSFYSPSSWLLTRIIFDVIPLRLIPTILVGTIVYFMVGLSRNAADFFKFLLIIIEFSLCMTLFNFLLACTFRQGGIAILISSLCNLFLMTYAGFFVNISNIPAVLRWLRYFSTLGFMLEALSVNEVGSGLKIVDTLAGVPVEIGAVIIMETLFGFDLGNYYRDVLVLFAFIAGFAVLLVGTVVYILRERR